MPDRPETVDVTLPDGTVVQWPAPTYQQARHLLRLLDQVGAQVPGAAHEALEAFHAIVGERPGLFDRYTLSEMLGISVDFCWAPRTRPTPAEPSAVTSSPSV